MDSKQVDSRIRRALDSVRRAFRGAVAQVDSGAAVQRIQIEGLAGETVQALEHGEPWGLTANPPAGCDCFVLPLGGATSHGVVIAVAGGGARVTALAPGEIALYSAHGSTIVLREGNIVEINAQTVKVSGDIVVGGDVTASGVSLVHHTHGGVRAGSDNTQPPH